MGFDKEKRGVLFKAKEKPSEKHPDFTGNITIEGKEWALSCWLQTSKNNVKYYSLAASEMRKVKTEDLQPSSPAPAMEDDSLPF